jgi:hypothetical protein
MASTTSDQPSTAKSPSGTIRPSSNSPCSPANSPKIEEAQSRSQPLYVYIVSETFIHEERGEPKQHKILAVFQHLSHANALTKARAEEVVVLVDRNENGECDGTRVKTYGDGTKMFRVDWGCLNYVEMDRFAVNEGEVGDLGGVG